VEKVEIEWGNHSLFNRMQETLEAIVDFVKREGSKGWNDHWHYMKSQLVTNTHTI